MLDNIGWLGSIMLAICAIPQAYTCWKQGHANGLDWSLLILWGGGELITFVYVVPKLDWPLICNYGANIIAMSVIVWYKWKPRPAEEQEPDDGKDHFPYA